jgi:glutamate dehydrogenase (NADP+)
VRYQAWEQDEGQGFWEIPADLALPCATQNEIGKQEAEKILKNDIMLLAEGANMPLDAEASDLLSAADILYAPGKASNAGGVAVSGLEMSQNSSHTYWSQEEVNSRLEKIMLQIHEQCLEAAARYGMEGNYRAGANIAGFEKVAEAMLAQGII